MLSCFCYPCGRMPYLVLSFALKDIPELQRAQTFLRQPCTFRINLYSSASLKLASPHETLK